VSKVNRAIANAKLTYSLPFLEGLKAIVNVGGDFSEGTGHVITDSTSAAGYYTRGRYSEYLSRKENKLIETYATYNSGKKFGDHVLDVTAGYSYQDWMSRGPNNPTYNQAKDRLLERRLVHIQITRKTCYYPTTHVRSIAIKENTL